MIEIIHVNYKDILKDINMTLDGTINYIQGENGAGKSTLLDCISGINKEYTGEIKGNDNIIYMNQNLYFDNRLRARDFVQFIFELNGIISKKNQFIEYIDSLGEKQKFLQMLDKRIGYLSGGERVKLFFLTLTFIDRKWYIFDEPFAGVDSNGKECMCKVMQKLIENNKKIIITTHEEGPINEFNDVKKWKIM